MKDFLLGVLAVLAALTYTPPAIDFFLGVSPARQNTPSLLATTPFHAVPLPQTCGGYRDENGETFWCSPVASIPETPSIDI